MYTLLWYYEPPLLVKNEGVQFSMMGFKILELKCDLRFEKCHMALGNYCVYCVKHLFYNGHCFILFLRSVLSVSCNQATYKCDTGQQRLGLGLWYLTFNNISVISWRSLLLV